MKKESALNILLNRTLLDILNSKEKWTFLILVCFMSVFAIVEAFTYSLIVPYINIVVDPERIFSVEQVQPIIQFFGWVNPLSIVIFISGLFVTMYTLKSVMHLSVSYWMIHFSEAICLTRTHHLFDLYLNMSYQFYLGKNSKILIKNLTESVPRFSFALRAYLMYVSNVITSLFLIVFLMKQSFWMSLLISVVFIFVGWMVHLGIKQYKIKAGLLYESSIGEFFRFANDALAGLKFIYLRRKQPYFSTIFSGLSKKVVQARKTSTFLVEVPGVLLEYIVILVLVVLIYLLVITVGNLAQFGSLFIFYAVVGRRLLSCLGRIIAMKNDTNYYMPSAIEYQTITRDIQSSQEFSSEAYQKDFDCIRLDNISFSYVDKTPVLENVSLSIGANESIGFVGHSGSGKTTLVDIISSVLNPTSGEFSVDGVVCANLSGFRHQIGYVPQFLSLLDDSIAANVAFGEESVDYDQVRKALTLAHLDDFVDELPQGVLTRIGDQGIQLSGGQRQRVAIARALYFNPSILIFDEATSALDAVSEKKIADSIQMLKGKMTILAIAHRLSTVRSFDRLYVMDSGQIVSSGRHDELKQTCSVYQALLDNK